MLNNLKSENNNIKESEKSLLIQVKELTEKTKSYNTTMDRKDSLYKEYKYK